MRLTEMINYTKPFGFLFAYRSLKGFFYGFLNKILMANVKLIFCDYENEQVQLRCYANTGNDIYIQIEDLDVAHDYNCQYICLDKATAIKLSKTLKSAINEIE